MTSDPALLRTRRPPRTVMMPIYLVLVLAWTLVRGVAIQDFVLPLTYVLPLLVCVWSRDRWALWGMAAIFAVKTTATMFWGLPGVALSDHAQWATYVAILINIGVGAVIIHLVISLLNRLDDSLFRLRQANEEIQRQTEELQVQSEELAQQNEELQSQSEELSRQNENLVRHEEELRISEERFRALYEQAAIGIEQLSLDGRLMGGNDMLSQILGYTHDELQQKTFVELTHPEDRGREQELLDRLLRGEIPNYTIEKRYLHRDGHSVWVRVTSSLAKGLTPGNMYRISIIEDITDQKRAEEARSRAGQSLRDINAELERRVEERTAELRQLNLELQRSNADLERFAYISSHDLQEPLRMVSSFVQLLERRYNDKLDDKGREYIRFAVDGAARMSGLIKDLLAYSRVNTRAAAPAPVDCSAMVRRVLQNLSLRIEETGAEVTVDSLPTVQADATQLSQVFQNLIENGLKFRDPDRRPRIHIGAESRDHQWIFTVRDNGIGIDKEYHDKIFVIFQRLHADRSKYPGSGIGLAIVKRIVERHGGQIAVDSTPGEGTTFTFTLPRTQAPA